MPNINIAGDVSSALSHFGAYGLAAIAGAEGFGSSTVRWTEESRPIAVVGVPDHSPLDVAASVRDLARRLADEKEWPSVLMPYGPKAKPVRVSPFSPRIKAIDTDKHPDDWPNHQLARNRVFDRLSRESRDLELSFLGALGEAAYWRFDNNQPRPDHGASRWEMKTRNRGEEFVQHRFSGMAKELSGWSVDDILAGITGANVNDSLGKNAVGSRTSTGLTAPGPTDVALAFVALWGISVFPMARKIRRINVTPCAYPDRVLHPTAMVLPVPTVPVTVARLESLVISRQLSVLVDLEGRELSGIRADAEVEGQLEVEAARRWLGDRGVPGVAVFPILKAGSSSAPERQVLNGRVKAHGR